MLCSLGVVMLCVIFFVFFFFKQKTAYEMRISDWSSDVCSSDLRQLDQPEGWLGLLMALVVVAATLMGGVAPGIAASIVGAVLTPVVLDTRSAPETALAVGLGGTIVALVQIGRAHV